MKGSSAPGWSAPGSAKSTHTRGLCSPNTGRGCLAMTTFEPSQGELSPSLTSSAEDSPARMSAWQAAARAWLESGQGSGLSFEEFLQSCGPGGSSLRTSLAYVPLTEDAILPSSFAGWRNSGIWGPSGVLTLNGSAWPSDGNACLLSAILETDAPSKYYLSPKACAGILGRAERRGKKLPERLAAALAAVAAEGQETTSTGTEPMSSPGVAETAEAMTR